MLSGVVIAGGRSTRFGDGDKSVADLAGTPMARRVVDRIGTVVDEIVVNCRPDQRSALAAALTGVDHPVSFALDDQPDRGPVAGIRNGLAAADGSYAAVVACDMPFVDPEFVAALFERAAGRDAAIPRPGEWYEPTQAVYRRDPTVAACDGALVEGNPRILDPIERLDYDVVEEVPDEETFRNVNTREELREAAADLRERGDLG